MLSRYRGRYRDIISRLVLNCFFPSGVPSRDQHNDPDDDDDDLSGDWEMDDKHCLSDQVGQLQSTGRIDRAALHRDLIVGMELPRSP